MAVSDASTAGIALGPYAIRRVEESLQAIPPTVLLPRLDPAVLEEHRGWLVPDHMTPDGLLRLSIHSWLLRTPHHLILIDACAGNHKPRSRPEQAGFANLDTPYLERLAAAGARPQDIDYVCCTHLHVDHVGWNTRLADGRWAPTFPNARYLFSRADCEYWDPRRRAGADPHPNDGVFEDSVRPVLEAGQAVLVDGGYAIADDVRLVHRPGHTPGHITVELGGETPRAIFTGDIMHHALQVTYPDWSSCFCELPEQARQTRRALLERVADRDTLLLPAHFGAPHAGRIVSAGDRFRFL